MALLSDQKISTGGGGGDRTRFAFSIPTIRPTLIEKSTSFDVSSRSDSRSKTDFRPTFMRTGIVSQANGSAFIEQGKTKVICSVYGPRPIVRAGGLDTSSQGASGNVNNQAGGPGAATSSGTSVGSDFSDKAIITCDFKYATFSESFEHHDYLSDTEEREKGMSIAQTLELAIIRDKYPKSTIDINILVLQDDGACLSASITCATLALAHAGILMYDLVPSCTISLANNGELWLDPTKQEERSQKGHLRIAYMTNLQEISFLSQGGELSPKQTMEAIQLAIEGCAQLQQLLRKELISIVAASSKKETPKTQ